MLHRNRSPLNHAVPLRITLFLAILAAERVINQSLEAPSHRTLVEEVLEETRSGGGSN